MRWEPTVKPLIRDRAVRDLLSLSESDLISGHAPRHAVTDTLSKLIHAVTDTLSKLIHSQCYLTSECMDRVAWVLHEQCVLAWFRMDNC